MPCSPRVRSAPTTPRRVPPHAVPRARSPPATPTPAPRPQGRKPARKNASTQPAPATPTPAPKPPGCNSAHKDASTQPATPTHLLSQAQQTTEDWYHSKSTTAGYARTVKAAKEWLAKWIKISRERDDDEEEEDTTAIELINPAFANAFDKVGEHTPTVLTLYTTLKCEQQGCKFSTAEAIRSAFKDYFEQAHGHYGDWKLDPQTKQWTGNPVFEKKYRSYYDSLKNRKNRTEVAEQSLPMLPADLQIIMEYLDSPKGVKKYSETKRLFFKAFATTAFTLWTRNEEMVMLQSKNVRPHQISDQSERYIEFRLVFRKTNKDPSKGDISLIEQLDVLLTMRIVQCYRIPEDPELPHIDCYTHMHNWLDHLQTQIARPLQDDDYIFPGISSTGKLKFGDGPISRTAFENLLEEVVNDSGVLSTRDGKFTTHCFRRGGCQYRFMWAPIKWSLRAVKWWGGWSSNDNVGTIMRYLLDELMAFEEGYGDIMMKTRRLNRHEVMEDRSGNTPQDYLTMTHFESRMSQFLQGLTSVPSTPSRKYSTPPTGPSPPSMLPASTPSIQTTTPCQVLLAPTISNSRSTATQLLSQTPPPPPAPAGPLLSNTISPVAPQAPDVVPRIPMCDSLDKALLYWQHGDRPGAIPPLQEWENRYPPQRVWPRTEAMKFHNIKTIVTEFLDQCGGSDEVFEQKYPGLRNCYTKLGKAICQAKIEWGETRSRSPRKKT